jgi:hypothetical protein
MQLGYVIKDFCKESLEAGVGSNKEELPEGTLCFDMILPSTCWRTIRIRKEYTKHNSGL